MLLLLLLRRFSRVRLCATPEMSAHQAPLSLGFSRQEHWSGLPFPSPNMLLQMVLFHPFLNILFYILYYLLFILLYISYFSYIIKIDIYKNHGLQETNTSDLTLGINWPPVRQDEKCRTNQKCFIHTHHQIL